jgi:hypothetical protein
MENFDLLNNDLQLSPHGLSYLTESAKWGKFLAILGFILCGIMVVVAFVLPSVITKLPPYNTVPSAYSAGMRIGITVLYFLCAVLLFFPSLYLHKFSTKMQLAVKSTSQENFDESLMNLKSMFKFYGILTIVLLSFYALVFIFGMLGLAMRG